MQLLVLASLLGLVVSAPSAGSFSSGRIIGQGNGISGAHGGVSHDIIIGGGVGGAYGRSCVHGEVLNVDGSCVRPKVSRNVYMFAAPHLPVPYTPTPHNPVPKLRYNVVFLSTPQGPADLEPIVVPPPQDKTLVYVLTKTGQVDQQVIEVPDGTGQAPAVFYVNYEEGENPVLPGGLTLQEALSTGVPQSGQIIRGDVPSGGGIGDGIHGGGVIGGNGIGGGSGGGYIGGGGISGEFIGGGKIGGGINVGGEIGGRVISGGGIRGGQGIGGGVINAGYSAPFH